MNIHAVNSHPTVQVNWGSSISLDGQGKEKESSLSTQKKPLQIDINLSNFFNASKGYLGEVTQNLPIAFSASALMVGARLATATNNLVSGNIFLGMLVGGSVSRAVRVVTHQEKSATDPFDPSGFKSMIESRPFLWGMGAAAGLGSLSALSSILITSSPVIATGVVVHYAADCLHGNDLISKEHMHLTQKASAVATSALSLVAPLESIFSLAIGAVVGAGIETYQMHSMEPKE